MITGFLLICLVRSKNSKLTIRELSRKTPDSIGAKLLSASTALRACGNRHPGTLMRCSQAWKPVEDCFDPISFECVHFQRLSQIIANLTRENLAEPEAEITNLPGTQTEKDTASARCRGGQRAWRNKKPVLSPWKTKMNQEEDFVSIGEPFSKHAWTHHQHEDILRYVEQALDDIRWTVDQAEFDDVLALKKDSAPGPDGLPSGAYRCAGGLGSKFLFNACRAFLEGGAVPVLKVELYPKTSDIDDNGRIIRSPDALRPLALCNCDCKLLTSAICRGLHWYTMRCIHTSQRCISSRQMTDSKHFRD